MTKELAEKLIAWYEESIAMIEKEEKRENIIDTLVLRYGGIIAKIKKEKEHRNILRILRKRGIGCGVCLCAFVNFNTNLHADSWVRSQNKSKGFWGSQPKYAKTKEEVIQCLQLRVGILKTFDGE